MQASPAPCDLRGGPRELSARLGDASAQVGLLRQQVVALVEQRVRGSGDGGDDRLELHLVEVVDDLPDDEQEDAYEANWDSWRVRLLSLIHI